MDFAITLHYFQTQLFFEYIILNFFLRSKKSKITPLANLSKTIQSQGFLLLAIKKNCF